MTTPHSQRGSLMIIAVVLIVIIGFLASTAAYLSVGQARAGLDTARGTEALYLAESGLEHGVYQWLANPGVYTGGGPTALGNGSFTVTVNTTDFNGALLPANQRRISSMGAVANVGGAATRTAEVIVQTGGSGFTEPFPNINNWLATGPAGNAFNTSCPPTVTNITTPSTQGTASYTATDNAPGSTGGAFRAAITTSSGKNTFSGYNQRTLTAPLAAGTNITLSFAYKKVLGTPVADDLMMAVDMVATDNTVYRLWSNCTPANVNWTSVSVPWTVPGGKTVNRIRLGYFIKDKTGAPRSVASAILFDHVVLTAPGASSGVLAWRQVVQ